MYLIPNITFDFLGITIKQIIFIGDGWLEFIIHINLMFINQPLIQCQLLKFN